MLARPEGIGGQRPQAPVPADQLVCPSRSEERAVPAIMLDDEDADEKPGGERRHWHRDPKPNGQAKEHRGARGENPAHRRRNLPEPAPHYHRLPSIAPRTNLPHFPT